MRYNNYSFSEGQSWIVFTRTEISNLFEKVKKRKFLPKISEVIPETRLVASSWNCSENRCFRWTPNLNMKSWLLIKTLISWMPCNHLIQLKNLSFLIKLQLTSCLQYFGCDVFHICPNKWKHKSTVHHTEIFKYCKYVEYAIL